MTGRQMLEALQEELRRHDVGSFFPLPGDEGERLQIFNSGDDFVEVRASDGRYFWLDTGRHPQSGTPDEAIAWLLGFASS